MFFFQEAYGLVPRKTILILSLCALLGLVASTISCEGDVADFA